MDQRASEFSPEVQQLPYFFTCFKSSDEAATFVERRNRGPGTYILRPSTSARGVLSLTVSTDTGVAHHVNIVQKICNGNISGFIYYIIQEKCFNSFQELQKYYSMNRICNLENIDNVRMLQPLSRSMTSDIRSDRSSPIPITGRAGGNSRSSPKSFDRRDPLMNDPMGWLSSPPTASSTKLPGAASSDEEIPPVPRRKTSVDQFSTYEQRNGDVRTSSSSSSSGAGAEKSSPIQDAVIVSKKNLWTLDSGLELPKVLTPEERKQQKEWEKQQQKELEKQRKKEVKLLKDAEKRLKETEKKTKWKRDQESKKRSKLGWCRPPAPLPADARGQESPYYTTPRDYRNHLEELKQMLRDAEMCDCGLRMIDAELALGWTVHRSREAATHLRVFYQHQDGNTTWMFPPNLAQHLNVNQINFIWRLCRESGHDLPDPLRPFVKSPRGSQSSESSSLSRSGSNGSQQSYTGRPLPRLVD